jgi:hypothetical protein
MRFQSYQIRRMWKLRAVKAFAMQQATQGFAEIRGILGERKLDALFNESFDLYPGNPEEGARQVRLALEERYAEELLKLPKTRKAYVRRKRSTIK